MWIGESTLYLLLLAVRTYAPRGYTGLVREADARPSLGDGSHDCSRKVGDADLGLLVRAKERLKHRTDLLCQSLAHAGLRL